MNMNTSYRGSRAVIGSLGLALAIATISACDKEPDVTYETPVDANTVVITNSVDECPRADGEPCE
jgi:hypothetical protein